MSKPVVAIIGAGHFGRPIIRSILSRAAFSVVVFARGTPSIDDIVGKPRDEVNYSLPSPADLVRELTIVPNVDYTSVPTLTSLLKKHRVHTVLSTLAAIDVTSAIQTERNLLEASIAASAAKPDSGGFIKRFSPAGYNISHEADKLMSHSYQAKTSIDNEVERRLGHGGPDEDAKIEWTGFRVGLLMNFLAGGATLAKAEQERYRDGSGLWLNIPKRTADIPGTGDEKISFTRIIDIGEAVAAALELKKWQKEYVIVGETTTLNEVVRQIEENLGGGAKIDITYEDGERMEETVRLVDTGKGNLLMGVKVMMKRGLANLEAARTEQIPNLRKPPMGVKEFLELCWKE